MRRRLRKKRRLAEFAEYGFDVAYQLDPASGSAAAEALLDRFIEQAIEAHGLLCGGGGGPQAWDFFVVAQGRASATEDHRRAVQRWLDSQPEVIAPQVGPLQDAWHEHAPHTSRSTPPGHAA